VALCHSKEGSGQSSTPTTVQNANPNIEVQRSTTTAQPPLTSTRACFANLTATQISDFETQFAKSRPAITTIAELCAFLSGLSSSDRITVILTDVENALESMPNPVNATTADSIGLCLVNALG
jgi:hypothetical protein